MSPMEQGVALLGAGRFHEAHQQFAEALRLQPLAAEPRVGLSQACEGMGDALTAAAWLSDACRVAPERAQLWMLQADLLLRHKQYVQALVPYAQLYAHQARDRATLLHYGFCLEQVGELEGAVARYREAIAQEPGFMEAHVDLAGVLWRLEDFEGALAHARTAVQLAPQHPYAVRVLGSVLFNLNRVPEAEAELRRALELLPGFSLAEVDLAFTLLLAGRLDEGWPMYALRWRDTDRLARPPFFREELEWKGRALQPLRGKRVAVYAEQGLGDVIQFIRYASLLQQDGATVYAVIQPELAAIVEGSLEGVEVIHPNRQVEVDCHAALLDLPMHYGTTLATIPASVPYIRTPGDKVEGWRVRLAPWDGKFKVGLAWSGSRRQVNNNNRAFRLSELAPLIDMAGVQCFSLQKGDAGGFTDIVPATEALPDFTREWTDFTDSAAMLANLDLVITVDTAVAHLAGAMGLPAWVMLGPNADWRWLLEREDSPWYPTLRLFRRAHGEPRAAQVARVARALQERLGH